MDRKIILTQTGSPENFEVSPCPPEASKPGTVRVRHDAIGVNFIDIYLRTGLYPLPGFPAILGVEGAGVVEAVGDGVTAFSQGDRVAYAGAPVGAYASTRLLPAERLIKLPDSIPTRLAAASMLKGLTAHMLLHRVYPVDARTTVLIHAAAGGLGTFLTRWAKHLGATVIGTTGSDDKAELARAHGADHVIIGRNADFGAETKAYTDGKGADYVIDGIGGTTLAKSFDCAAPFATVASIGQAAGPIPAVPVEELGPRRSIALSRPSVMAYAANKDIYPSAAADLFRAMEAGILPEIGAEYALEDVQAAHEDLEAGRTTGSVILRP